MNDDLDFLFNEEEKPPIETTPPSTTKSVDDAVASVAMDLLLKYLEGASQEGIPSELRDKLESIRQNITRRHYCFTPFKPDDGKSP